MISDTIKNKNNNRMYEKSRETSVYLIEPDDGDIEYTRALNRLSSTSSVSPSSTKSLVLSPSPSMSLQKLAPEILESIFIYLPKPCTAAPVCRLFHLIVTFSKSFKRRWLRQWLNPKLPEAFMPTYSDLCLAIESKTPINILVEIVNLQILGKRALCSSRGGHVMRLVDAAYAHTDSKKLIPFLIKKGMRLDVYIQNHSTRDFELTEGGNEVEKRMTKDYFSVLIFARQHSFEFYNQILASKNYFSETDLAFSIVLHERFDAADALSLHMQHTLDVLDESVDRQYTNGIAWAFTRGLNDVQKRNPLYLRICVEKADVKAVETLIINGALINISPSSYPNDPGAFGSTSFLEFSLQCFFACHKEQEKNDARLEIVKLFLNHGADPNADDGRPLALTVTNYNWELTQLLLDAGADPACGNQIALKMATELGYKDMAKTLHHLIKVGMNSKDTRHSRSGSSAGHNRFRSGSSAGHNRFRSGSSSESRTEHNRNSSDEDDENGNKSNKRDSTLLKAVRMMAHSLEKIQIRRRNSEGDAKNHVNKSSTTRRRMTSYIPQP
ncbi:6018_t:CDS:1 [Ambispora leptoticha]|uniref:6018_t:CDS:1 n=1 Tax=Ambispora leptoticha TaxID=144679 RepID=A0A9N9EZ05_9GLOM|nr:6018_t:CDS:1 [Ambispora leptoticha]